MSRSPTQVTITTPSDGNLTFEIIELLEFDSERKCMSIVTRLQGSGRVTLYLKGADSMVYCNLSNCGTSYGNGECEVEDGIQENGVQESTESHLDLYAKLGLRTLCLAKRVSFQIMAFEPQQMLSCTQVHTIEKTQTVCSQQPETTQTAWQYIV